MTTKKTIAWLSTLTTIGAVVVVVFVHATLAVLSEESKKLIVTDRQEEPVVIEKTVDEEVKPEPIEVLSVPLIAKITEAEQQAMISLIQETVATLEVEYGRRDEELVANSEMMIQLAMCESSLRERVVSSNGLWYGLYQWRLQDIPGGKDCALDASCSTIATVDALQRGEAWRWPTCLPI